MRSALSLFLLAAACGSGKPQTVSPAPTDPVRASKPDEATPVAVAPAKPITTKSLAAIGLDPDAIDKTADPCEDFYQFACGNWVAKAEIPADKPVVMRSFVAIQDRNLDYMHGILEQARTKPGDDPVLKQLGAYYGSCMDEAAIEKAGIKPIKPLLAAIDNIKDPKSLSAAIGALHAVGFNALFRLGPTQDAADARNMIAEIDQGGIGLPDRDYYLKDDDKLKSKREAYRKYVVQLLGDVGVPAAAAAKRADAVLALETEIAKVSKDKVARRDPKTMYNKIDRAGVAKAMPAFDWEPFWKTVGLDAKDVTVTSPDFLVGVDALVAKTPPNVWRDYLTTYVVRSAAPYLTKDIEAQRFKYRAALTGAEEQEPRWKRCTEHTDGALGDLLGQAFVRDRFAGASKSAAEEQVHAIVAAMTANLAALPWMDATTKQRAAEKLTAMAYQIGYPKKWRTYDFKLDPKTWGANALAADRADNLREMAKVGKPVDKDDWNMSAPTVNAEYVPPLNTMLFPAGILQPPFYSVDASIPVNLGAMGVVVGHELTHGFDDQGAQYDKDGNLRDWWQADTQSQFKARTQCVIDQYSKYEVSGGTKVNGANTVGENIADIGGVKLAYAGYHALRSSATDSVVADGFTEDQQFFLGFGQTWCAAMRPDYEQLLANVDVHSPAKWRVNGALSATPDFAKAFRCKAGAKMRPANACVVW